MTTPAKPLPSFSHPIWEKFPELYDLKLCVALPSYDGRAHNRQPLMYLSQLVPHFTPVCTQTSLLAACFNITLCHAIRLRDKGYATHFLMMHDDIYPEDVNWFAQFWSAYKDSNAQLLGAVSPIKDTRGVTSIAVDPDWKEGEPTDEEYAMRALEDYKLGITAQWSETTLLDMLLKGVKSYRLHNMKKPMRLTLRQIAKMPTTFTLDGLLLNTGCLMFDLREPWLEKMLQKGIGFHIDDAIKRVDDVEGGRWAPSCASEDWNFTRDARANGCERIYATTAMHLQHVGQTRIPNHGAWGTLEVDDGSA